VVPRPDVTAPLVVPLEFEQGRPAGLLPGSNQNLCFAVNLGGIPTLEPDTGYRWEARTQGLRVADVSFRTRPATDA
jgi:hypothetical protein